MNRIIKLLDIAAAAALFISFFLPWAGLGKLVSFSGYDIVASAFGSVMKNADKVLKKEPDTFFVFVVLTMPIMSLFILYNRLARFSSENRLIVIKMLVVLVFSMVVYSTLDEINNNLFGELVNPFRIIKIGYVVMAIAVTYFLVSIFVRLQSKQVDSILDNSTEMQAGKEAEGIQKTEPACQGNHKDAEPTQQTIPDVQEYRPSSE